MTAYTVQCGFSSYHANTVSVEADTLEEALEKAIETANQDPNWKSVDHCGPTHVDACCMGRDEDPWDDKKSLSVPARFSEQGEPPIITLTGPRPPGDIEVTGGTVRIRFEDEAGTGTLTTELSDPPPPPANKPVVTIRRDANGAPAVDVRGGKAVVRLEGWGVVAR